MTEWTDIVNWRLRLSSIVRDALARVLVIIAALCAAAAANAQSSGGDSATEVTVSDLTVARELGRTTLTMRANAIPTFAAFAVEDPARIVIDFANTRFAVADSPAAEGVLTATRFGALDDRQSRLVLELSVPALIATTFARTAAPDAPAELVLSLEPVDGEIFARSARGGIAAAARRVALQPRRTVVIDPGHGGVDPGAVTEDGLREKDLTLAFSQRLADTLSGAPSVEVKLTREDDRFLSLSRRIRIARAFAADLFVSIHADAAPQDYVQGATVYTLSQRPSDAQAAALAARENLADSLSDTVEPEVHEEVSSILADLMRRETKHHASTFAATLVGAMGDAVRMNNNPRRSARFRVLMAHDIPSVLLELGYLTNEDDMQTLQNEAWQERAANGIAAAIQSHFGALDGATARASD